ncbi:MAG TPA: PKD domain-containing protein [Armatimonadota bacterium]|jgi:prepilin-type processing-associated H-X9-DG protein
MTPLPNEDDAREYLANARAQGYRDAEIARTFRAAGWTRGQIRDLLRPPLPPGPPPPDAPVPLPPPSEERPDGPEAFGPEFVPPDLPGPPPVRWRHPWLRCLPGCLAGLLLLVIVALVLAPVVERTHLPPSKSNCLSNVKQLTLGMLMYAGDNNGQFPLAVDWPRRIYPYVRNAEVYVCPSDLAPVSYYQGLPPQSYGMNLAANELAVRGLADPAALVVLFDAKRRYGGEEIAVFRHHYGLNAGFADGHVRWLAMESFKTSLLAPPGLRPVPLPEVLPPALSPFGAAPGTRERYTKQNWARHFWFWSRMRLEPPSRDGQGRPLPMVAEPPSASSDRVKATLELQVPDEVWLDDRFSVSAHGYYRLDPELARLVRAGQATIQERYEWEVDPAVPRSKDQLKQQKLDLWYQRCTQNWDGEPHNLGIWGMYIIGVFLPDGSVEWARAEAHQTPKVKRLRVTMLEPVDSGHPQPGVSPAVVGLSLGQPAYTFRAEAELLPDHLPLTEAHWQWWFGDGTSTTANPVSHSFSAERTYLVLLRAVWGGQVAEQALLLQPARHTSEDLDDLRPVPGGDTIYEISRNNAVSAPVDTGRRCPLDAKSLQRHH